MENIPSVLACDVGNTTIRLASVQGETVSPVEVLRVGQLAALGEAIAELWDPLEPPKCLVAASVNPTALKALEAAAAEAVSQDVLVVGRDLPLPIDTDLTQPEMVGVDRLCCAAAAFDRLGMACVVADFGTAVTIDYVSDKGIFMGGAILPGLAMGAESLSNGAAQLPRVDLERPDWVFGKDTRQAIVGGLIHGAHGALRELVETYATAVGHWPIVIATGGDAELVCGRADESDLVQAKVPDLALRGIAMAYYRSLLK